ncbi:hypothetical protein LWC35_23010 [Pseudonocardia kujensis]|uniref:hypothetical protein n=1 Tax=Pseudonocardia kujensis TaxID=1128675 RepID=UPI001E437A02|nr:hypothetical protein [Pseudonocardia kujensis]MCE0765754.1 hypothetical protein [Pseudonocardia kujensis]
MAELRRGTDWIEQLVELHVLAENGDTEAARKAADWVADDPTARAMWASVERDCARLRHPETRG